MMEFCQWIKSIGLYYSFHKIEALYTFTEEKKNIFWGFLKHSAINTANLKNVNPKIIELKGAFLNIGLSLKNINKEILHVKNESIYLDLTSLSLEELERVVRLRIFNQNIGFILIKNMCDFLPKIEILKQTILDYYSNMKSLDDIRSLFFKTIVSEDCFLPVIATNLYEEKILILISNQNLRNSINIIPNNYDRLQVPFSLNTSDLSYFYKW